MTTPNVLRAAPGGLRWNENLGRYIDARGRIVSGRVVRNALDQTIVAYGARTKALAGSLRAGTTSLRSWELQMRTLIKDTHLVSSAAAVGGWEQLQNDPAALGRAGREIRAQYEFLDGFVRDIASGKQKLTDGLIARAVMYIEAGRGTYEAQRLVIDRAAGYDQERNIRHASDSCEGCIRETARGWVGIGALVPIGDRNCLTRCRCEIERQMSASAARARRRPRRRPRVVRRPTVAT